MELLDILGKIYGAALRGEPVDETLLGDDFNLKDAFRISKSHSLGALFAFAMEKTEYFKGLKPEIQKAISTPKLASIKKSLCFDAERESLYKEFSDNGVDYISLKGIIIKELYPEMGMREFADHDILIRPKSAKTVKKIFSNRDYKVESFGKTHHDVYEKLPFYNFEIHRYLFDDNDGTGLSKFYKDVWPKSHVVSGHEYALCTEDTYAYILGHAFKHLENSGNGLRYLIDIYVIEKAWGEKIDRSYFESELDKMLMLPFYEKSKVIASKFLGENEEPLTEEEKELLDKIFVSGTYGNIGIRVENSLKKQSKFKYFMKRAFIPWSTIRQMNPFIAYTIIFIPFFWAWRLIKALLFKRDRVKAELDAIHDTNVND